MHNVHTTFNVHVQFVTDMYTHINSRISHLRGGRVQQAVSNLKVSLDQSRFDDA